MPDPATVIEPQAESPAQADEQIIVLPDFSSMGNEVIAPTCDLENIEYCEACQ